MLTNFFGKSNPINYLLIGVFIIIGYLFGGLSGSAPLFDLPMALKHIAFVGLFILSMLLLDFIIRKNVLTRQNTYSIFFFGCFMVMLPLVFLEHYLFISNVFLLLALRRIMSLRADKNSEKKILDASIWITLASFFNFWSILFFAVLYIAIIRKPNPSYKHLLIPPIGFFAVFTISTAFHYIAYGTFQWLLNWRLPISFDFSAYNSVNVLLPVAVIGAFMIWTVIYRVLNTASVSLTERPNYMLMLLVLGIALIIAILSPQKNGAELLFIFAPLSIIITNYMESLNSIEKISRRTEFWFKETLLWLVLALAVSMLII